ncbi:MAG: TlpA family protein disulfide reductase [Solirubrobacteraceae bacterium]
MSRSERPAGWADGPAGFAAPRYGRWVGALALVILGLITLNTILTPSNGAGGLAPGARLPPFAVPLAEGTLTGDADIATHPNDGSAGKHPACAERGTQILNVCQLYEQGPVVLALFVDSGSCPEVLGDMQALVPTFPGVRFAGVAIKGRRAQLRALERSRGLRFPIGIDADGVLTTLYKTASCPQLTFAYPGGVAQGRALLSRPPLAALRARVATLVAGARARGWRPPR